MKKLSLILISVIFLSGCTWGKSDTANNMPTEQKSFFDALSSKKDNKVTTAQDSQKTDSNSADNTTKQETSSITSNLKKDNQDTSIVIDTSQTNLIDNTQEKSSFFIELSERKDSIKTTIKDVQRKNNQTIISISIDNHLYDISKMDIKGKSTLKNIKPIDFKIKTTQMGGHHIEGDMVFSGDLKGDLKIGLKDNLIFNFKIQ